ncbi:hypothetical protein L7F22_010955 [Adiantum nelumboides]|nr:hypothetical protein [Adiantum nelumboides]
MPKSITPTNLEGQKKRRKERVFFKLSHHALGVFSTLDNPLLKKRRMESSLVDVQEKKQAEAAIVKEDGGEDKKEDEEEKSVQSHKLGRQGVKWLKPPLLQPLVSKGKPKSYLEKLRSRLSGGQFRMLNEKLYTSSGDEAFRFFKEDPSAFDCASQVPNVNA